MPRRIDRDRAQPFRIPFSHGSTTADATTKLYLVDAGQAFVIERVSYINPTGLAVDATNFFNLKITDGTNIAANWSTETGTNGALPANTAVEFALSATLADRTIAAGEYVTLFLDEGGTATLPAGSGFVEGYLV
jgi:hypothetical protein